MTIPNPTPYAGGTAIIATSIGGKTTYQVHSVNEQAQEVRVLNANGNPAILYWHGIAIEPGCYWTLNGIPVEVEFTQPFVQMGSDEYYSPAEDYFDLREIGDSVSLRVNEADPSSSWTVTHVSIDGRVLRVSGPAGLCTLAWRGISETYPAGWILDGKPLFDIAFAWSDEKIAQVARERALRAPKIGDIATTYGFNGEVLPPAAFAPDRRLLPLEETPALTWVVYHVYGNGLLMLCTDAPDGQRDFCVITREGATTDTEWLAHTGEVFARVEFTAPPSVVEAAEEAIFNGELDDLLKDVPRRTYTIKTVAELPFGTFPEYPVGPALVPVDDWCTSVGFEDWAEGYKYRVGAFKVLSDHPYQTERHPLDKQAFPTQQAAQQAKYDAGLIGYMIYDDTEWARVGQETGVDVSMEDVVTYLREESATLFKTIDQSLSHGWQFERAVGRSEALVEIQYYLATGSRPVEGDAFDAFYEERRLAALSD